MEPVHFQILHSRFVEGKGDKEKWVDEQTVRFSLILKPRSHVRKKTSNKRVGRGFTGPSFSLETRLARFSSTPVEGTTTIDVYRSTTHV
jgi:hypothetical protein